MFEEEYRQEMQKTAPSDFARDALLKEMDTLRYRPKRPPVRAIAGRAYRIGTAVGAGAAGRLADAKRGRLRGSAGKARGDERLSFI